MGGPRVQGGCPASHGDRGLRGAWCGPHRTQIFWEVPFVQSLKGLIAPSEQLPLQRDQGAEQLLVGGLGGWQDNAGIQEILHAPHQVLPGLGQVGVPAKHLRSGPGTQPAPAPRVLLGTRWPLSVPVRTRG